MAQYIDKSAVVAEIERQSAYMDSLHEQKIIGNILSFLDTLEVKEVDLKMSADRCMAEEIITNLKRVENDYRIDLTKEMEWLRNRFRITLED